MRPPKKARKPASRTGWLAGARRRSRRWASHRRRSYQSIPKPKCSISSAARCGAERAPRPAEALGRILARAGEWPLHFVPGCFAIFAPKGLRPPRATRLQGRRTPCQFASSISTGAAHAGADKARAELLTAALGQATADKIVVYAAFEVLHSALVVTKGTGLGRQRFGGLAFALGVTIDPARHPLGVVSKQGGCVVLDPLFGGGRAFPWRGLATGARCCLA